MKCAGAKEAATREKFSLSATAYFRPLNWLLDQSAAAAYDAMLVKRLHRLRGTRARQRSARRLNALG